MQPQTSFSLILFVLIFGILTEASVPRRLDPLTKARLRSESDPRTWNYLIPNQVQNGTSQVRFDISTPRATLSADALLKLDSPQVSSINASVFDWWYFDVVSETNLGDSFVVTFFTSSAAAFPFLDSRESSVLIVYLWASFANGTVFADFLPATFATVAGGEAAEAPSTGNWSSAGFSWTAQKEDLSQYEIIIASEEMQVEGRFTLTSVSAGQLPSK